MDPRKLAAQISNRLMKLTDRLLYDLRFGVYVAACAALYHFVYKAWLPDNWAASLFWTLIVWRMSSGQSRERMTTLTRTLLETFLGNLPKK